MGTGGLVVICLPRAGGQGEQGDGPAVFGRYSLRSEGCKRVHQVAANAALMGGRIREGFGGMNGRT